MIVLDAPQERLTVLLSATPSTPLPVYISYATAGPRRFVTGEAHMQISTDMRTDVLAGSADEEEQVQVRQMTVRCPPGQSSQVTIGHYDGGNLTDSWSFFVNANEMLQYDGGRWTLERSALGMRSFSTLRRKLSGSTDGRGIKVAATASAGTTIHTAVAGTTAGTYDEIWLWAVNSDTTARKLTIEFGGTTSPDDQIEQSIPPESGLMLVVPGLILQNGAVVRAFASAANVVMIHGFVNLVQD